jgi:lipoyl(octanoyl) transferase
VIVQTPKTEVDVPPQLSIKYIGLVEYLAALELQREIHRDVVAQRIPNTLLILEHPPVFTAGKRTQEFERPKDGTPVVEVDRGGRITWHGPGQLVGYPIIKLSNPRELVGFVRTIEAALIKVCEHFGVNAVRVDDRSGVWVSDSKGDRKVAAIGIRVASGVSMHGFALNVCPDLRAFAQIVPCGIDDASVSSLSIETGREIALTEVLPVVEKYLTEALGRVSA